MTTSDGETGFRIAELLLSGMTCGSVLMTLALEARGEDDPALVAATAGLAHGMGHGFNCGVLTGGACVLGLALGRRGSEGTDDPRLAVALDAFGGWFHAAMTERHGGIDCAAIMRFDEGRRLTLCPALIAEGWSKLNEALADAGADLAATETRP